MEKVKRKFYACIFCIAASALSLLMIPFSSFDSTKGNIITAYAIGIIFWLGLILGYILLFEVGKVRKADAEHQTKDKSRPGFLKFFSNKTASYIDFILIVSFIILAVLTAFNQLYYVQLAAGIIFIFSLQMHGIFNGADYIYIKQKEGYAL